MGPGRFDLLGSADSGGTDMSSINQAASEEREAAGVRVIRGSGGAS